MADIPKTRRNRKRLESVWARMLNQGSSMREEERCRVGVVEDGSSKWSGLFMFDGV